jgi:hypothetical protein
MGVVTKQSHWEGIIESWKQSGQSQISFCKGKEISYGRFCYWKKRFELGRSNLFVPIKILSCERGSDVGTYKVETSRGVRIHIPSGAKAEDLSVIFRTLGVIG